MRLTSTRPFKTMKDYVVPICLTVFNVLFLGSISWIAKVKAKSDKADVKKIVKEELKDTHKDIEANLDSITWVKEAIHDIQLYNQLSAEKSKNTRRNIQETLEAQVEDFKDFMKTQKLHNDEVLKSLSELVTAQAVMNERKKDK